MECTLLVKFTNSVAIIVCIAMQLYFFLYYQTGNLIVAGLILLKPFHFIFKKVCQGDNTPSLKRTDQEHEYNVKELCDSFIKNPLKNPTRAIQCN